MGIRNRITHGITLQDLGFPSVRSRCAIRTMSDERKISYFFAFPHVNTSTYKYVLLQCALRTCANHPNDTGPCRALRHALYAQR